MRKLNLKICFFCLIAILSCNQTDFSNPEEVMKKYLDLSSEYKEDVLYDDFLSSKSKEFVTKDEYQKSKETPDSLKESKKIIDCKISSIPFDINNPTYRRFKVDTKTIHKKDTVNHKQYYSLINENGQWKVVWTNTLLDFVDNKYADGNYSEARKTLEKIIEIDPFSGYAYRTLAWCYLRDQSLMLQEWENGIVKNAKYAVTLEEDISANYSTLSSYYLVINNVDLAIQTYERGLAFSINKKEKESLYSNLAFSYTAVKNFVKAEEYVNKSLELNDKKAFTWFTYGNLMLKQGDEQKAKVYFEKALQQDKMENALQCNLYYSYALCCFKADECEKAREFNNKALDIEPNNADYQALYNKIKHCKI